MRKRSLARITFGAMTLGAAVAAVSASADGVDYDNWTFIELKKGPVRGLVVAGERPGSARVGLSASLHGLAADSRYAVVVTKSPCSAPGVRADVLLSIPVRSNADGNAFARRGVRPRSSPEAARSVRVTQAASGTTKQLACAAATRAPRRSAGEAGFSELRAGTARALVVTRRRNGGSRVGVSASLHGLAGADGHTIVASARSCSRPSITGDRIWRMSVRPNAEGGAFTRRSPRLLRAPAPARSVRLIRRGSGGAKQVACGRFRQVRGAATNVDTSLSRLR